MLELNDILNIVNKEIEQNEESKEQLILLKNVIINNTEENINLFLEFCKNLDKKYQHGIFSYIYYLYNESNNILLSNIIEKALFNNEIAIAINYLINIKMKSSIEDAKAVFNILPESLKTSTEVIKAEILIFVKDGIVKNKTKIDELKLRLK